MSRFLCNVILVLVSRWFFQCAEAVSSKDRDRVILTYTTATDRCKGITSTTHPATKEAADSACETAFKALDDIGKNSCHGWRKPACRHLRGYKHSQCSCTISWCTRVGIKHDDTKTFRDCASEIWTDEIFNGEAQPSEKFLEIWKLSDENLEVSRALPAFFNFEGYSSPETTFVGEASSSAVGQQSETAILVKQNTLGTGFLDQLYCEPCGMPFTTRGNFKRHLDKLHSADPSVEKSAFYCQFCRQYYSTKGNLVKHFRNAHPGKDPVIPMNPVEVEEIVVEPGEFHCYSCRKNFSTRGNLIKHARIRHPETELGAPVKKAKRYRCYTCGEAFDKARHLLEHQQIHSEGSQCYVCKLDLGTRENLEKHFHQNHRAIISGSKKSPGPSVGSKRKHT